MKVHCFISYGFDANIYLVEDKNPILIDTGTGFHISELIEKLRHKIDINKIKRIILTHRHFDHTGGAFELSTKLGAQLYAHESDVEALSKGDSVSTCAVDFDTSLPKLNVQPLRNRDTIDCGNTDLEVIHTPGHTIGSIVLYDAVSKSLFSGDTVFTEGSVGRWDLATGNYKQLVDSLKKLSKLDVINLYPGHGLYAEGDGNLHLKLGLEYLITVGPEG